MQNPQNPVISEPAVERVRSETGILMALVIALLLHIVILLVPLSPQAPARRETMVQIELQLTAFVTPPEPVENVIPESETVPKTVPEKVPPAAEPMVETSPVSPPLPEPLPEPLKRDFERMNSEEKAHLTASILSSQFITEESVAEQIFGKPLKLPNTRPHADFYYPVRQSMLALLDTPIQELPFAYTPGLIHFAYAPGVKGDLQRFWDVITPEFGWTTDNGTEVKCIWVLIVGGCGWK